MVDFNNLKAKQKEKVSEAGYEDYFNGVKKSDNPYCEETQVDAFQTWEAGWCRADSDSDDGNEGIDFENLDFKL